MDVVEVVPDASSSTRSPSAASRRCARIAPGTALRLWSDDAFCGALRVGHGPVQREGRPALRQPADRPVLRRGRRAGRHPGAAPRRPGAGPRLGRLGDDPVLRRADQHRPGRRPCRTRCRTPPGSTSWTGRGTRSPSPRSTATCGSTCRSSRCSAPWASPRPGGEVRSSLVPDALRRQHGHPADAGRAPPATSASTSRARCSRSATATTGRARARPAAPPSRAR